MVVIQVKNHEYWLNASSVQGVMETAEILGLQIDSAIFYPFGGRQKIVKLWGIGELADYLKENTEQADVMLPV